MELPELPSNHLNVLRRIRRCEGEVAAQVVLEHAMRAFAEEAVRLEREACAKICEEQAEAHDTFRNTQAAVGCDGCWEAILARSAVSPPAMQAQKE